MFDRADVCAELGRLSEVERGVGDRSDLAGGDQLVVDRGEEVAVDGQPMSEHVANVVSTQIPVGVIHHVDDRWRRRPCRHRDVETRLAENVLGRRSQVPRETFIPVRREHRELDGIAVLVGTPVPRSSVESPRSTVELVGALVRGDRYVSSVQDERPTSDAVCISAARRAEVGGARSVRREVRMGQHDVGEVPVAVGEVQFQEAGTEVGEHRDQPAGSERDAVARDTFV